MLLTTSLPRLGYKHVGGGESRVLLIMGYGMRGEVWSPQIKGLSKDCEVLYFDNRGVGASDAIGDSLSMLDMARDAARVLDAVDWQDNVHLVGVSMGGMIAQELALHTPDRFASLSLGHPCRWSQSAPAPHERHLALFMAAARTN